MTRVQPRPDVQMMEGYHSPQVEAQVRLNTNESPVPPPGEWHDAFVAELSRVHWHRYPDRSATALRAAIAGFHGLDARQVFPANGSNEVLQTLLLTYAGPGRTVLTFEPTYQLHSHIARLSGAQCVSAPRGADFTIDLDVARAALDDAQPDVTFLCSPNNPTGMIEAQAVVEAVVNAAPGLVVIDEAYGQFASWSAIELLDEERPLVVVRTFSKTWSMAATRLGYLLGPSWLVAELDKVTLPYHLDAAKQIAGRLALQFGQQMEERVAALVVERERVVASLSALDVDVFPSAANFVLFRPRGRVGDEVWRDLLQLGVLVRNCSGWAGLDNCLRVTVGTADENTTFLGALASTLGAPSALVQHEESA
jgi:histidinol-phosphate aminotransferase